jgi:hypothetical protein
MNKDLIEVYGALNDLREKLFDHVDKSANAIKAIEEIDIEVAKLIKATEGGDAAQIREQQKLVLVKLLVCSVRIDEYKQDCKQNSAIVDPSYQVFQSVVGVKTK